jgi:hypothetical protein
LLAVALRLVLFLGVALALWAWRGRSIPGASSSQSFLPAATFGVAWFLVYLCLAAACVVLRRNPAARALILLAVALTWAWIVVRPESEAAGFLVIAAAVAALLAAAGLAGKPAAALTAIPVAWLLAALVLSRSAAGRRA